MGCFSPNKPADLNYGKQLADTLRTQTGLEPLLLSSEAQYDPAQTNLSLANMNSLLFGSPGADLQVQNYTPAVNQTGNSLSYGGVPKDFLGQVNKPALPVWQNGKWTYPGGASTATPGAPPMMGGPTGFTPGNPSPAAGMTFDAATGKPINGVNPVNPSTLATNGPGTMMRDPSKLMSSNPMDLLSSLSKGGPKSPMDFFSSIFGGDSPQTVRVGAPQTTTTTTHLGPQSGLVDLQNRVNSATRGATVGDISSLGPGATAALLASNPQAAGLINTLNQQAQSELDAGTGLTPDEQRIEQQQARGAWAARGMGGTDASAADEVLRQYALGQQLQRQRQGFATNVLGTDQSLLQNPMLAMLTANGGGTDNQAQSLIPKLFNPESPYAGNLYAANQQMAAMFADPSTMSKISSVVGTVGSLAGAASSIASI